MARQPHVTMQGDQAPFAADRFTYLQVADRLAERIRAGEFGRTGKLPGGPGLCDHYGVGAAVVRHARQELLRRGLVVVKTGRGTFTA